MNRNYSQATGKKKKKVREIVYNPETHTRAKYITATSIGAPEQRTTEKNTKRSNWNCKK